MFTISSRNMRIIKWKSQFRLARWGKGKYFFITSLKIAPSSIFLKSFWCCTTFSLMEDQQKKIIMENAPEIWWHINCCKCICWKVRLKLFSRGHSNIEIEILRETQQHWRNRWNWNKGVWLGINVPPKLDHFWRTCVLLQWAQSHKLLSKIDS